MSETTKRRLPWFQYSLRTLLVVVLLGSIDMSWVAARMQRARRQKEAVEAIRKLQGTVFYDYSFDTSGNEIKGAQPPGPFWLRSFLGDDCFANVTKVFLGNIMPYHHARVTDTDLVHLKALPQLDGLWFGECDVTDAGLGYLKALTRLETLNLGGTKLTDAGLKHLKGLTHLRELGLSAR